ncbi:MAG: hypothetical protein AB7R69_01670 [Candidatus Babeliales bacterium]
MKFNKNLYKKTIFLTMLASASFSESILCNQYVTVDEIRKQIYELLEVCVYVKQTKHSSQPFSFFVDELIKLVDDNKKLLEEKFGSMINNFLHDAQGMRTASAREIDQVKKTLFKYKVFMPDSFKKILLQLHARLLKRLNVKPVNPNAAGEAEESLATEEQEKAVVAILEEVIQDQTAQDAQSVAQELVVTEEPAVQEELSTQTKKAAQEETPTEEVQPEQAGEAVEITTEFFDQSEFDQTLWEKICIVAAFLKDSIKEYFE